MKAIASFSMKYIKDHAKTIADVIPISADAGVTLATGKTMELYALTSNAWQSSASA